MTARGLLISLGIALAVALLGNIPLMGLPGALVWSLFLPLADLLLGGVIPRIRSDALWPLVILMTLLWPISIPLGYVLVWKWFPHQPRARVLWWVGLMALWGFALSLYFAITAPKN